MIPSSDVFDLAVLARRRVGLVDDYPAQDVLRSVEQAGVVVFALPLGEDGIAGAYRTVRAQPFVLVNSSNPPVRQRFTLAHELGHHVLDHGRVVDDRVDPTSTDAKEQAANWFAAGYLMPPEAITRWLQSRENPSLSLETLVRLAAEFGVSASAMCRRLQEIGRLKDTRAVQRLETSIENEEHLSLGARLELEPLRDSIADGHRDGIWLPLAHRRRLVGLVDSGQLSEEALVARLPPDMSLDAFRRLAHQSYELDDAAQ